MTFTAWGLIVQIIGTLLLSAQIFKAPQEENDEASSWYDGNPFMQFSATRKFIGFIGLLLLIAGFAMQFSDLNIIPSTELNTNILLVLSISFFSVITIAIIYKCRIYFYQRKRWIHFARLATSMLEKYDRKEINYAQMINFLYQHISDLPSKYAQIIGNLWYVTLKNGTEDPVLQKGNEYESNIQKLRDYLKEFQKF